MYEELKNLNIVTCSDSELKALICQTSPIVILHAQASQELVRRSMNTNNQSYVAHEIDISKIFMISNGRALSEEQIKDINEEDYHIILDMTTNQLRYRKDPEKHSRLIVARPDGIGPDRSQYLVYLLEHPLSYVTIDTRLPGLDPNQIVEPNTLSKTIGILRKLIGQGKPAGPYTLTERPWSQKCSQYKLNPKWKYLMIKNVCVIDKSSPHPS
jgi:hypothetical protein